MLDLQSAVMDDDALDHQLQNRLALGDTRGVQPRVNPFTEGAQAGQGLLSLNALLA